MVNNAFMGLETFLPFLTRLLARLLRRPVLVFVWDDARCKTHDDFRHGDASVPGLVHRVGLRNVGYAAAMNVSVIVQRISGPGVADESTTELVWTDESLSFERRTLAANSQATALVDLCSWDGKNPWLNVCSKRNARGGDRLTNAGHYDVHLVATSSDAGVSLAKATVRIHFAPDRPRDTAVRPIYSRTRQRLS
jgi:hypothetical protein